MQVLHSACQARAAFAACGMDALRCHLLIGPPSSGKSTTAALLAPLLEGMQGQPVRVLATDAIRAELFGDPTQQGPPDLVQQHLRERITGAVASGLPVIVDATHARRPWRLEILQQLPLPRPVQWIGWWHFTPLTTCLRWNQRRPQAVPTPVIRRMHAALCDEAFRPCRAEGFAAVVAVEPTHHRDLAPVLRQELQRLNRRISAARNRHRGLGLHGHSRLLDQERLLYLLRLLAEYPDLARGDAGSHDQLEAIISPLPTGELAEQAAAFLRRLHGRCYGDGEAVRRDLHWLQQQGFFSALPCGSAIQPLPAPPADTVAAGGVDGGYPPMGDAAVFCRVMALLRHVLQHPFDRDRTITACNLHQHLLEQLQRVPGAYLGGEQATLRKDIEKTLTPYGFRLQGSSPRQGYCLGTALLSAPRLVEVHGVVRIAAQRLGDPTVQDLLVELEERLRWGGISVAPAFDLRRYLDGSRLERLSPLAGSLAEPQEAERLETAILQHRRVQVAWMSGDGPMARQGSAELWRGWPLQLVFSGGFWFLAWEDDCIGRSHGLLRCERLDQLRLVRVEPRSRRHEDDHASALARLQRLVLCSGGVDIGDQFHEQDLICRCRSLQDSGLLQTVRLSCRPEAFAVICESLPRLAPEQIRVSRLPPSNRRRLLQPGHPCLSANPHGGSYPYPVELDLPRWIVREGREIRQWLYSFGSGVRVDAPEALSQEQQGQALAVVAAFSQRPPDAERR